MADNLWCLLKMWYFGLQSKKDRRVSDCWCLQVLELGSIVLYFNAGKVWRLEVSDALRFASHSFGWSMLVPLGNEEDEVS